MSPASFNNHWGVPLTLARMPADARFAVFEIGMNHAGEIAPLARLVRPHVAIVTTVEPVHLEFFDSVEDIARAKAEIFHGLEPGGAAVLNRDNPHYDAARSARAAQAGVEQRHRLRRACATPRRGSTTVKLKPRRAPASRPTSSARRSPTSSARPGRHLVQNSLAVLAAVALLGGDLASAALALGDAAAAEGARRSAIGSPLGGGASR